jgi:cyclophilin family peptidyl-prolyl cis-trans isomerase
MAMYPEDVRLVVRQFPWDFHDKASLAAQASEAAGAQGMFWEMFDILLSHQGEWSGQSVEAFQETLVSYAQEIGLPDLARFEADLTNGTYAEEIQADFTNGLADGIQATPTIYLNGISWQGSFNVASLAGAVETLGVISSYPEAPPMTIDQDTTYYATLVTERGDIVVELFTALAPQTVNNFIYLACVGYYDDNTFYRVLPDFGVQSGDPTNTGMGRPGYTIPDEASNGLEFDRPGLLSMALAGYPNTAGGQFFITYSSQDHLNGVFTVFGEVVSGMDVLESLQPRDPQTDPNAPTGNLLETILIQEEG